MTDFTSATPQIKQHYPLGQEIANAITHGIWALLSVAALVVLIVKAALHGNAVDIVSYTIFGCSAILLFTMSTLYHAIKNPKVKRIFKVMDHSSIFIFIAGTYTPIALTSLRGSLGWLIFGIVWGITIAGIAVKPFLAGKAKLLSTIAYVAMGWLIVFVWKPFTQSAPSLTVVFLAAGGIAYTLGAVIYMIKGRSWSHPLWHIFVGAGATLHFFAIMNLL